MKIILGLALAVLSSVVVAQAPADATDPVDAALAQARERHAPVLIDFHAPWCYSCYFMKMHVLNGPEWDQLERQAVVVELDADSPQGARWRDQWKIKMLPAYVVLNEKSQELGRILGEQTRADFYKQLGLITARQNTLENLQAQVQKGGMSSIVAMRKLLAAWHARRAAPEALDWVTALPSSTRGTVERDPAVQRWLDRLALQKAVLADDHAACVKAGAPVLASPLGCEYPYELDSVMSCAADLPAAQRNELLAPQRARMDKLLESGAFGTKRCADQRSVVLGAADLDEALGDKAASAAVLKRAIDDTRKRIGGNLGKDRNLADNLRVYLDHAGDTAAFDELMPQLIKAYPDDYVYAFRFGKSLLARGKAAEALPWLEQAADKAYGNNRLKVAEQRVLALKALKRDADAKQVVSEALKANGPWFPEDAQKLKALVTS